MQKSFLMKVLEVSGGFRISRHLNRNRPTILMYHRVHNDPWLGGIAPDIFSRQLAHLKRFFRVVGINQLIDELNSKKLQPYSVALTFDDGHGDFYTHAWPLLKKYRLPASLYVTTGFVDGLCWLWPDLLRYQLLKTDKTQITLPGVGWFPLGPNNRVQAWNRLGDHCLTLAPTQRSSFLKQLGEALGVVQPPKPQAPFCPVTWDQVREMHREGLDVGSHSVTHPILSSLPLSDLRYELAHSSLRLSQELGELPRGVCYPNGMAKDVGKPVEALASEHYEYGLVAYPRPVDPSSPMCLGRWAAPNNLMRFKQTLSGLSRNDNYHGEYR